MKLCTAREAKKLSRSAELWRADTIAVLEKRQIQAELGPESMRLLKTIHAAGVIAVNSRNSRVNKEYSKCALEGVNLVPITSGHDAELALAITRNGKSYGYPVGKLLKTKGSESVTIATHSANTNIPDRSFISFMAEFPGFKPLDRAAVMTHELVHADRFFTNPVFEVADRSLVMCEAPAYEAQFTVYDVCHNGLLSIIARNNIDTFKPDVPSPQFSAPSEEASTIIKASHPLRAALRVHMLHMLCGYDPAGPEQPPDDLVSYYHRREALTSYAKT